jgi:two-component system phosphate regulon response regulator PhoB
MPANVLVVEDEPAIAELLTLTLHHGGFHPIHAADAQVASSLVAEVLPDLIVLDRALPGGSGIDFLRALRLSERGGEVPVIMLSAYGTEGDRVEGLEAGADDYLPKPFSPKELLARIKAVLRRRAPQLAEEVVAVHGLTLDTASHRVYVAKGPERVHSRAMLLDQVWGDHAFIEERTVDVHIKRLRTVLKPAGYEPIIETVRGSGYRLSAQGMVDATRVGTGAHSHGHATLSSTLSP